MAESWGDGGVYRAAILAAVPRVLSLMDREPLSPTAGCCDRTYWAWKFTDFPGARFQEALCCLSFLWATPFTGNGYQNSRKLLEWIEAGLAFWATLQHADGSFDEAYPFERSLAATAFTSFYVSEALAWVGPVLPGAVRDRVHRALRRAGEWLGRNDESHGVLSNHLAAAAAALYHVHRVTGEARFLARSREFLARVLAHQSGEGWYEEYGGADPGYQTHGSFYLVRYWELSGDEALAESLGRAMTFLAHFVHPDGSLGGEYASRNTQTYYPAAFEMFASRDPAASWIARTMRPSVASGAAAGLGSVDAYNYFPFLNNLVFADRALATLDRPAAPPVEPSSGSGLAWFPEAGMARVRRARYDAVVGTAKGGVVKVFDRARRALIYSDCGYLGRLADGRIVSSQYQDRARPVTVDATRIAVDGAFAEVSRPQMTPARFAAFRLFTLSVGRLAGVGRWLKRLLVKVLIYRRHGLDIRFRRTIEFRDDEVVVRDELAGSGAGRLETLRWGEAFTTIHMGSSRYFVPHELAEPSAEGDVGRLDPARVAAGVTLRRVVRFS